MKGVFVHANGLCESTRVGEGTRIWAFAHVLPGAQIGRDCNLCDHVIAPSESIEAMLHERGVETPVTAWPYWACSVYILPRL